MERINRNGYTALVRSLMGKGEAVVLTGHRRAGKRGHLQNPVF